MTLFAHDYGVEAVYAESEHRWRDAEAYYRKAARKAPSMSARQYLKHAERCSREECIVAEGRPISLKVVDQIWGGMQ